jgi:CubicO group peptidase (beta-lactamase class C family)
LAALLMHKKVLPRLFQPGTQFQYGEGISIIGRLIEVWSGQRYDVFLKEALFEPLGKWGCTRRCSTLPRRIGAVW